MIIALIKNIKMTETIIITTIKQQNYKWFKLVTILQRTSECILTTLGLNGGCTSRFCSFCQLILRKNK